jgi:hypothetical protein
MTLYVVNLDRTICVMADTPDEAEEIALQWEREEIGNPPDWIHAHLASAAGEFLPAQWFDSIPYGGDDDRTVRQILDEQRKAEGK